MGDEKIIFLGMCRKAAGNALGYDLLGVGHTQCFPFFPNSLGSLYCLIGISKPFIRSFTTANSFDLRLTFTNLRRPEYRCSIEATLSITDTREVPLETTAESVLTGSTEIERFHPGASVSMPTVLSRESEPFIGYQICPVPVPQMTLWSPTEVSITAEITNPAIDLGLIGHFLCLFAVPTPLSIAEKRAIESRPNSSRAVFLNFSCRECSANYRVYALLDPSYRTAEMDNQRTYIHDAPDTWVCQCRATQVDLTYMKRGIHDLFRRSGANQNTKLGADFIPLYERRQIHQTAHDYQTLINSSPREEDVQKYLEEHAVLWSFLAPIKILHKPSILTQSKADFGILTSQGILYLTEIEKPQTLLATQKGSLSSELEQGVKQIRDWGLIVDEHRKALLDQLGLDSTSVRDIRFLLIAGLSRKTPLKMLEQLHRNPLAAKTTFLCFDDLLSNLYTLSDQLQGL